jgi:hypothetical protein
MSEQPMVTKITYIIADINQAINKKKIQLKSLVSPSNIAFPTMTDWVGLDRGPAI